LLPSQPVLCPLLFFVRYVSVEVRFKQGLKALAKELSNSPELFRKIYIKGIKVEFVTREYTKNIYYYFYFRIFKTSSIPERKIKGLSSFVKPLDLGLNVM
jgi:hypothetical protein